MEADTLSLDSISAPSLVNLGNQHYPQISLNLSVSVLGYLPSIKVGTGEAQ